MLFSIITTLRPARSAERAAAILDHRAYLGEHKDRLLAVGTTHDEEHGQPMGSTYVIEAIDWDDARRFVEEDPMTRAGAREHIEIAEWRMVAFDRAIRRNSG